MHNEQKSAAQTVLDSFDAFVHEVVAGWSDPDSPLTPADFSAARFEIVRLVSRLRNMDGNAPDIATAAPDAPDGTQYMPVTPAPWP